MRDMQFVKDAILKEDREEVDSLASKRGLTAPVPLNMSSGNLKKGKFANHGDASPMGLGVSMGKPPLSKAIFPVSQSMREQIKGDSLDYSSQPKNDTREPSLHEHFGGTEVGTGIRSTNEISDKKNKGVRRN